MKKLNLLVALALTTWSLSSIAADTIKIGVSGPFTGGSAPMGVSNCSKARAATPCLSPRVAVA